jgi:nicotinamidase/pyrazinamidase
MSRPQYAPRLYNQQAKPDAKREPYAARISEFAEEGRKASLAPASEDRQRIAVILVDYQFDFVDPHGTLAVRGAQDDVDRFLTWFYTNADKITSIYASMDTHLPNQIFFSTWWEDQHGTMPDPARLPLRITEEDVESGRWRPRDQEQVAWSKYYVHQLKVRAKKELVIWPYHTMLGTMGHMLVPPISEALAWHSTARQTRPTFIEKGRTARTEYYSIFGAEVPDNRARESYLNTPLLEAIESHDQIYIAGEAQSHCVLETAKTIVKRSEANTRLMQRIFFLHDCSSSIQGFEATTRDDLAAMQKQGVQMVLSAGTIDRPKTVAITASATA